MLKIGLTGGVGSGKSTACRMFDELGAAIIDADLIARDLLQPGAPAVARLAALFGDGVLDAAGHLKRAELRQMIFSDPNKRRNLDSVMHPLIYAKIAEEIPQAQGIYCIIAAPLLLETAPAGLADRVLVIDCPLKQQLARVLQRDGVDWRQARRIIQSQMPRRRRLAMADDVIDNSNSIAHLAEQVQNLHQFYKSLASVRTSSA